VVWSFSEYISRNRIKAQLCDYDDPDLLKYCPSAIPPMLVEKQTYTRADIGPQMDPDLLKKCLD
jgi:hypothetical protein